MGRLTRRQYLGLVGATAAASVAGCTGSPSDEWPQARAVASRTGHNPAADGPSGGGQFGWTVQTGGLSAPVVANDRTYLNGGEAVALSAADGERRWDRPMPAASGVTPVLGENRVYIPSRFTLFALDRADGSLAWSYTRGRQITNGPGYDGRQVYVGFRARTPPFRATVSALDPADGTEHWQAEMGADNVLLFTPAVRGGLVTVGKESVYAHDAATGERQWTFDLLDVHFGTPAMGRETVYVGAATAEREGLVLALDAADGTERWRVETGLGARSIAFDGDSVYATSDQVYAIDAVDGTVRWRVGSNRFTLASPSVAGDTVYVSGVGGSFVALNPTDGTERWRFATGGVLLSAPAIVGQSAYVVTRNGVAYRIDGSG